MNVFIQGMRRSGTTILFDILWEDAKFDCYYEPLAADKNTLGGGSSMRSVDYFDTIRKCRTSFMQLHPELEDMNLLNYGAPRQAELEFQTEAPGFLRDYIKYLISRSEHTIIKFTRMHSKVNVLRDIDPHAKLIHIVRDPRAITTSYLFGRNQKNRHRFPHEKAFFGRKSHASAWSSYPFSEFLLQTPEYDHLKGCEDFMRVLILWKYNFRMTHNTGKSLFKENYFLLRHEDLITNTEQTLETLCHFLEQTLPAHVKDWAMRHVNNQPNLYAQDNPEWLRAFQLIKMEEDIHNAGYACRTNAL